MSEWPILKRRLRSSFHVAAGSFFPISYLFLEKNTMLLLLAVISSVFFIFEFVRLNHPVLGSRMNEFLKPILKEHELTGITSSSYVLFASLLSVILFDKLIAVLALLFMVFGDTAAVFIGKNFSRIKMLGDKTFGGSIAMLVTCLLVGYFFNKMFLIRPLVVVFGALTAAVTEHISTRIDDNLTVPLASGTVMTAIMFLL